MSTALIRGRSCVWGIENDGDTFAAGVVVDMSHAVDGDTDFVLDGQGFVIAEVFFNDKDECEVNVLCEQETAVPARGDDVIIAGIECIVQSASVKWNQKGWKMLSIKGTKFANLTD